MSKLPNKKPRVPNQDGLKKIAQLFVHHQVAKQVGPAGAEACLKISLLLGQVCAVYDNYFDMVDTAVVNIPELVTFFPKSAREKLNGEQWRKLQKEIEREVTAFAQQIKDHTTYLRANKAHMELMAPGGPELLERTRDELLGLNEPTEA